ncbi:MAG: hypothetical protein BGO01_02445 [Armatimonadetes bacterium 55-13]|nr:MAG: hypothetical protein BGO01_02445 [Armatimonadetes bacterium 55-13]
MATSGPKILPLGLSTEENEGVTDPKRRVRILLLGFMIGLVVSGVTAFPLPQELNSLADWMLGRSSGEPSGTLKWILRVREGVTHADHAYPFLFYGTDWLAFAHLAIAVLFIGPYRDPVRNVWVIHWGMIACASVIPLALICGEVRGIPFGWRLLDCPFGVVGIVPLEICRRMIRQMEIREQAN